MASDTKNVKLGVCKVLFDGQDLGYTQGGVDVSVKTEAHKVMVDQFGKTSINEYIMGREVTAKVPLAETTLENLVTIMPGATMVTTGGSAATGTITIATNPTNSQTITVNGVTVTFKTALTAPAVANEVLLGATAAATATNLAAALNTSATPAIATASYVAAAAVVTVTYGNPTVYGTTGMKSTEGNAFTLVTGTAAAAVTMSAATLSGGTDYTSKFVEVTSGIGTDLLSISKELRFHPIGKPDSDVSDDFVIMKAATAGALDFAYKLENERVFNVDFSGYPDPVTGKLFSLGK